MTTNSLINNCDYKEYNLSEDPWVNFMHWMQEAQEKDLEPTGVVLSTITAQQRPRSRYVLWKGNYQWPIIGENTQKIAEIQSMCFYTNYHSDKAKEITHSPYASLSFFWPQSAKQLRVEGKMIKMSEERSRQYFNSRQLSSRIASMVSNQDQIVSDGSREMMDKALEVAMLKGEAAGELDYQKWGGYDFFVDRFEFFFYRPHRFHDRFTYQLVNGKEWLDSLSVETISARLSSPEVQQWEINRLWP